MYCGARQYLRVPAVKRLLLVQMGEYLIQPKATTGFIFFYEKTGLNRNPDRRFLRGATAIVLRR